MVAGEVAVRGLARQHPFAHFAFFEVTDRPFVGVGGVVRGEGLGAGGLGAQATEGAVGGDADALHSSVIGADTVEKIWIPAKSIAVLANHVGPLLILHILRLPLAIVIVRPRILQLVEQHLVFVDDACEAADAVGAIQRSIRIETLGLVLVLPAVGTDGFAGLGTH